MASKRKLTEEEWLAAAPDRPHLSTFQRLMDRWGYEVRFDVVPAAPKEDDRA